MFAFSRNASSRASSARLRLERRAERVAVGAGPPATRADTRSPRRGFRTSKRVRTSSMRSKMVSSFVALSMTWTGRRHLAAVVHPRRDAELVPFVVAELEVRERSAGGVARRRGEHLRQDRARARSARRCTAILESIAEAIALMKLSRSSRCPSSKQLVVERDARLRRERLDDALMLLGERHDARRCRGIPRVQELQHADDAALAVDERDRQEGLRAIVVLRVERLGPGEVEPRGVVGVRDVHGALAAAPRRSRRSCGSAAPVDGVDHRDGGRT